MKTSAVVKADQRLHISVLLSKTPACLSTTEEQLGKVGGAGDGEEDWLGRTVG